MGIMEKEDTQETHQYKLHRKETKTREKNKNAIWRPIVRKMARKIQT